MEEKKMKNRKNIKADAVKGNAVLVRMNRHSFPENGILSTEEFNRIAGYKEEGKKVVLYTDRSLEEMSEGNILTAAWDAICALDGKAILNEYFATLHTHTAEGQMETSMNRLKDYWGYDQLNVSVRLAV